MRRDLGCQFKHELYSTEDGKHLPPQFVVCFAFKQTSKAFCCSFNLSFNKFGHVKKETYHYLMCDRDNLRQSPTEAISSSELKTFLFLLEATLRGIL